MELRGHRRANKPPSGLFNYYNTIPRPGKQAFRHFPPSRGGIRCNSRCFLLS